MGEHVAKIGGHEGEVGALRVGKERTEVGGMHQLIESSGGGGLDEGELEEALPDVASRAAVEVGVAGARGDVEIMEVTRDGLRAVLLDGEAVGIARGVGGTSHGEGAGTAVGVSGDALQGAELHDGLVMLTRMFGRHQLAGQSVVCMPSHGCIAGRIDGEEPPEDALHIAIDDGVRGIVRKGDDGGGGVVADAGQGADGSVIRGEAARELVADGAGGGVQVTGAGVVAKALPEVEDVLLVGVGQGADVGEALEEAAVVIHSLHHARLLEDDLGDPNAIGVASLAPGQGAAVRGVPLAEDVAHVVSRHIRHAPPRLLQQRPGSRQRLLDVATDVIRSEPCIHAAADEHGADVVVDPR